MQARFRQRLYSAAGLALPLLVQMHNDMTAIPIAARVSCEIRATRDDRGGQLDALILATGPGRGYIQLPHAKAWCR